MQGLSINTKSPITKSTIAKSNLRVADSAAKPLSDKKVHFDFQQAAIEYADVEALVDRVLEVVGKDIVLGLPLAIGKPITFTNAIYRRAKADASINLRIETGISLELPRGKTSLEKKFLQPFVEREFAGVPELLYMCDLRSNSLPDNIQVGEFFFKAGSFMNSPQQLNYTSTNYTHAVRDLLAKGVNVVAQLLAERKVDDEKHYSLSSNSDLALDVIAEVTAQRESGRKLLFVGEVNSNMPFMRNDAEINAQQFDCILQSQETDYSLFAVPEMPIVNEDYMIGCYASSLVQDGGTLQLGIGSLCSAMTYNLLLRHQNNASYKALLDDLQLSKKFPIVNSVGGCDSFSQGLYGCSELMVDGFMHLYKAGILKREVFADAALQTLLNSDEITTNVSFATLQGLLRLQRISARLTATDVSFLKQFGVFTELVNYQQGQLCIGDVSCDADLDNMTCRDWIIAHCLGDKLKGGVVMHGAFFIGPKTFYNALHEFSDADHSKFCMTSVKYVNDLYNHFLGDETLKQLQRKQARFVNSAMMVTLDGSAVSDALENGQVVSGVGGQYNFVAQSHELRDARSILKLRSCCVRNGTLHSNVLFNYGHTTIPRQLRDIVVTEYGIADLRSKPDHVVYTEMIKIADSRFQADLLAQAKAAGKVAADYVIPEAFTNNTPAAIAALCDKYNAQQLFPRFPFGCSFTDAELTLASALKSLKNKSQSLPGKLQLLVQGLTLQGRSLLPHKPLSAEVQALLLRMDLQQPQGLGEHISQCLLINELQRQDHNKLQLSNSSEPACSGPAVS